MKKNEKRKRTGTAAKETAASLVERARASASWSRLTFEDSPYGMALFDRRFRFLKVNAAFCRLLGYTRKELLALSMPEVTHPDDVAFSVANGTALMRGKLPSVSVEKRFVKKSGEVVWAQGTVVPISDDRGKPVCLWGTVEDISERKRTEEALRTSLLRLRLSFENNLVGMALIDKDLRFIEVNNTFCRFTGYTEKELLSYCIPDVVHPDSGAHDRPKVKKIIRRIYPHQVEDRFVRKNGEIAWGQITSTPIFDVDGEFLHAFAIIEDITERKLVEEKLRTSEQKFRYSFENNLVGMALIDKDLRFIGANRAFCRFIGYAEKELLGRSIQDVSHPDGKVQDREKVKELILMPAPHRSENRFIRKDGKVVWAQVSHTGIRDTHGNFLHSFGIVEDITERKRAEEALRESEERFRRIFENAPFGVYHSTIDGKLIDINENGARLLGYASARELIRAVNKTSIGEHLYVNPVRRESFVKNALLSRGWYQVENLFKRKDGKAVPGMLRFRPVQKDDGPPTEFEGFVEDISARKKAEEQLRHYQRKLRNLGLQFTFREERERQRMANNVHDYIGQSLSCAMLALGSLEKELQPGSPAHKDLRAALEQIEQGIKYARSVTFELSPAILFKLGFEAVVDWLGETLLAKHGIRCRIEGDASVKIPGTEMRVILFRVARELMINVIKHAKAREVRVSLNKRKGYVEMTVQDDGKGFDTLEILKESKAFGLFSLREQVIYVGGRMSIVSRPGKGAAVSVALPLGGAGTEKP